MKTIFAKKGSVDKTSSSANTKHFFAFHGCDISSDPFEIFMETRSIIQKFLSEFSLEVYGVAKGPVANYPDGATVAVEYSLSEGESLEQKVSELKDSFKYKGAPLFTINVDSVFLA